MALLHNSNFEPIHAILTYALPDPDGIRHPDACASRKLDHIDYKGLFSFD
jgi:hypothetical protein